MEVTSKIVLKARVKPGYEVVSRNGKNEVVDTVSIKVDEIAKRLEKMRKKKKGPPNGNNDATNDGRCSKLLKKGGHSIAPDATACAANDTSTTTNAMAADGTKEHDVAIAIQTDVPTTKTSSDALFKKRSSDGMQDRGEHLLDLFFNTFASESDGGSTAENAAVENVGLDVWSGYPDPVFGQGLSELSEDTSGTDKRNVTLEIEKKRILCSYVC